MLIKIVFSCLCLDLQGGFYCYGHWSNLGHKIWRKKQARRNVACLLICCCVCVVLSHHIPHTIYCTQKTIMSEFTNEADDELAQAIALSMSDNSSIAEDVLSFEEQIARAMLESMAIPQLVSVSSAEDVALQQAMSLSLNADGSPAYRAKLDAMMAAAGPLRSNRHRQCVEAAKGTGGLIVGK